MSSNVEKGKHLLQRYQGLAGSPASGKQKAPLVPRVATVALQKQHERQAAEAAAAAAAAASPSKAGRATPLPRVAQLPAASPKSPAPIRFPGLTEREVGRRGSGAPSDSASKKARGASLVPRVATLATPGKKRLDAANARSGGATTAGSGSSSSAKKTSSSTTLPRVASLSARRAPVEPATDSHGMSTPEKMSSPGARERPLPRVARLAQQQQQEQKEREKRPASSPATGAARVASTSAASSPSVFARLAATPTAKPAAAETPSASPGARTAARKKSLGSPAVFDRLSQPKKASSSPTSTTSVGQAPEKKSKSKAPKSGASIFDKLTDSHLYTGSHKARFDESGKGRGAAGRRSPRHKPFEESFRPELQSAPASATSSPAGAPAVVAKYEPAPIFDRLLDPSKFSGTHKHRFDESGKGRGLDGRERPVDFEGSFRRELHHPSASPAASPKLAARDRKGTGSSPSQYEPAPIFDRLLDPSKFSGTHKHRFDESGKGRGLDGRERPVDFEGSFRRELHHPSASPAASPKLAARDRKGTGSSPSQYESAPIFDRLTDVNKFTGVYRERFDANTGKGKGLAKPSAFEESLRTTVTQADKVQETKQETKPSATVSEN